MIPKKHIIPVFIPHEGCAHNCVFCDQRIVTNSSSKTSANDVLITAGSHAKNDYPAELAFYGGSFTALPIKRQNELLSAAQPFLDDVRSRSIRISTRPDCIDEETVRRLKESGVKTIELGVQSMCDDVLNMSRRGHTQKDAVNASRVIKEAGLALILQMMTGLPGDSSEKSLYTAKKISELMPDGVRVYPTVILRDTELHKMWLCGTYHEHALPEAIETCANISLLFNKAKIPIIRLGLNPTDTLSAFDVVGGAYHPAFGDMVYSKILFDKAASLLKGVSPESNVRISVSKGRTSTMIGQRRANLVKLTSMYLLRSIKVIESAENNELFSVSIEIID